MPRSLPFSGLLVGLSFSILFGRLYLAKLPQPEFTALLTVPPAILIVPAVVGLTIGIALQLFAKGRESGPDVPGPFGGKQPLVMAETSAVGLVIGAFLGAIGALIIFFLAPFAGHQFLTHIINGVLAGGGGGAVVRYLSAFLEKW